jgi:hypothetical protein
VNPVWPLEVEHICILTSQSFDAVFEPTAHVSGHVSILISASHESSAWYCAVGVEFGIHDYTALLPVKSGKHFLGRTVSVQTGSADFVVPVSLEYIDDFASFFGGVDSCYDCI